MPDMDPESIAALDAIRLERIRQVEVEGYTLEMDDANYRDGQDLPSAAAAYCIADFNPIGAEKLWPWEGMPWEDMFNPKSPERDLIRAGSLIVAELARIYRARKRKREGGS
jgi:hypothetical protein